MPRYGFHRMFFDFQSFSTAQQAATAERRHIQSRRGNSANRERRNAKEGGASGPPSPARFPIYSGLLGRPGGRSSWSSEIPHTYIRDCWGLLREKEGGDIFSEFSFYLLTGICHDICAYDTFR